MEEMRVKDRGKGNDTACARGRFDFRQELDV